MTTTNWTTWYQKTESEARMLVAAEAAMRASGLPTDPDIVVEMTERILRSKSAPAKLRRLADLWEAQQRRPETLEKDLTAG